MSNGSVEQHWQRIMTWMRAHTPATAATVRSAAPAAEVYVTQRILGLDLPASLLTWWGLMNGVDDEKDYREAFNIPPFFMPLSVARVREEWVRLRRYTDEECCRPGGQHVFAAGTPSFVFCSAVVPIGRALDGGLLCVDLRSGDAHGCLMEWTAETGFDDVGWEGVEAMLAEVAERLDDYTPGMRPLPQTRHQPIVEGWVLSWR